MILLDTHIWVWWANDDPQLSEAARQKIVAEQDVALSVISCWEVATAVERGRLTLDRDIEDWIDAALLAPRLALVPLTPRVAVESTKLPGSFHRDPGDRIIVATARVLGARLLTVDRRILKYAGVRHA